jgi:hypothetical protein
MKFQHLIGNFLYNQKALTNKRFARTLKTVLNFLPDTAKVYTYRTTVTFGMTTEERNVSHSKFAELFGVVRESYG